ncbi:hypothetical protein [Lignipirellula cremea]|uniref:WGR domain-containing protein n=1 Tax=Lignipirellula cremea TaxID=2528010 RepID=A0A518DV10_9BACT|nr:hypothetical protein [Lignipirellula cremea]QDU95675.1 hypothetical protein Pla8534_34920 [Lignipirellula cremea]
MKLLRQARLHFREGNSDKVYEVDLCEVGSDQCVVNFRYGRRGSVLRDGSRTPAPITFAAAERLYEDLVASKQAEGYQTAGSAAPVVSSISPAPITAADAPAARFLSRRDQAILDRIKAGPGTRTSHRWPLSRAVWRAGERGITEAAGLLPPLVGKGDRFLDYSIAWSLGRIGDDTTAGALRRLQGDTRQPYMVRRMAAEALRNLSQGDARQAMIKAFVSHLPSALRGLAEQGPASDFTKALVGYLKTARPNDFSVLEAIYLIDSPIVRPGLLEVLRTAPIERNYFQRFRYLFKSAEFRGDAEVFGLLAKRFEKGRSTYRAYRPRTRLYLRRRVWRTLERLAIDRDQAYVPMAVGVLLPFTDEDAQRRREDRLDWTNADGRRGPTTRTLHWDDFGYTWAFNQILFGQSDRYRPRKSVADYVCAESYLPGTAEPGRREELYGALWEQQPEALLRLLLDSQCRPVHGFAVKILRELRPYCQELSVPTLCQLLATRYDVTTRFAFEQIEQRYRPAEPDRDLVLAVMHCDYAPGRAVAQRWINQARDFFFSDAPFLFSLIRSPQPETRTWVRSSLRGLGLSTEVAEAVIGQGVSCLLGLTEDDGDLAHDVAETLLLACGEPLRQISAEVIRDLLAHPLPAVQLFAGALVLQHATLAQNPPAEVLQALLSATDSTVREMGGRIVAGLSDATLKQSPDLVLALLTDAAADVRESLRGTVQRLAVSDPLFGRALVDRIVEQLLTPGLDDGVPRFLSQLLQQDLSSATGHLTADEVWRLLRSRSQQAQEAGGSFLASRLPPESLSAAEVVELASHSLVAVRRAAWRIFEQQLERMRRSLATTVRVLDSSWDDTRSWACDLFRTAFQPGELSPAVLISLCDSTRVDVQQFGKELITRHWNDEHGAEYLRKLSEHPAPSVQLFATNFLERYAGDQADRLRELAPYFLSVLSQVNRGRTAKDRVLRLLAQAAAGSEATASVAADIVARQSATAAIGDRARLIEIMTDIRRRFPEMPLPLQVRPVPVRSRESSHGV